MKEYVEFHRPEFKFIIEKERKDKKWLYFINHENAIIHRSHLFDKTFLLKSLNKSGPVIGDCFTKQNYRGQSIYPKVINTIAKDALKHNTNEVFIIVNRNNLSSMRGVEKAGFIKFASLKSYRWLWFYFGKKINY